MSVQVDPHNGTASTNTRARIRGRSPEIAHHASSPPHSAIPSARTEILWAVAAGEIVQVTNHGRVAAVISPPNQPTLVRLVADAQARPARRPVSQLTTIQRVTGSTASAELLDDVRGRW